MAEEKVWDCNTCKIVEPVSTAPGEEYDVGDREPCIHCDGVAYVRLKDAPGGRATAEENGRGDAAEQLHDLAIKYRRLTGKDHAVIVPEYDSGWWMGTLCTHDGPEIHVSGVETGSEVLGAVGAVLDYLLAARGIPFATEDLLAPLSPRERDVVAGLRRGVRLSPLARELGISGHTVRNHAKHIFRKLGVSSQVQLLAMLNGGGRG